MADQADTLVQSVVERHGSLDVLVNNAGVQVEKTIAETTDEEFGFVMDVNVRGVFNCSRAAVRQMQTQASGGVIINIGSVAGNTADHGMAVYNASKGAVHALTRAIAVDHGKDNIRCNAIAPGWIATALADAAFELSHDLPPPVVKQWPSTPLDGLDCHQTWLRWQCGWPAPRPPLPPDRSLLSTADLRPKADHALGVGSNRMDLAVLKEVEQRVLWLATRIIDAANRREGGEVKVGGHQASCASLVSVMTALWFGHITGEDKVAVKPHASPVYHAIKYLTGELDASYLTMLRQRGGLQAYPSRTKDPDVSDFSTGSVGLGAVAPLFSALTRRYVDSHFGERPDARFIALVGDAELDEGNVWEAVSDPVTDGLGQFTMVIDLNRQSLDRVIPDIAAVRMEKFFADAGWHVASAKYGSRLTAAFETEGGDVLRSHIDAMPNEAYQALFAMTGGRLRSKFLHGADASLHRMVTDYDDEQLKSLVTDLGGHDLGLLLDTFKECDAETERPSVVFAYTIKGWGLPMAGDPMNHAALLTPDQLADVRSKFGLPRRTNGTDSIPRQRLVTSATKSAATSTTQNPNPDPSCQFQSQRGPQQPTAKHQPKRLSGACWPAWPRWKAWPSTSLRPLPTFRSQPISAAGSTRQASTPPPTATTMVAPSAFLSGHLRRLANTSSWASRR